MQKLQMKGEQFMERYTYTLRQEISHQGLNKYRVVTAPNRHELNKKISAIRAQWNEQWREKKV